MSNKNIAMEEVVESKCGTKCFKKKHVLFMILILALAMLLLMK